mgnify:CR=1 FL=1
MRIVKRIFLFGIVNILIVLTLSVLLSVLGLTPRLSAQGFDWATLAAFCAVWGFGGAFLLLVFVLMVKPTGILGVEWQAWVDLGLVDLEEWVGQMISKDSCLDS